MKEKFILDEDYYMYKNKPCMLLHVCCAPCSSSVIESLEEFFEITLLFYNPNIYPFEEYIKRKNEAIKFAKIKKLKFLDIDYENDIYEEKVKELRDAPEGGLRCKECIYLRLYKTFEMSGDYDYICSTLSVSPHKNSKVINDIGISLEKKFNVKYLINDFKKRDGFKRSIELSKEFDLYRQDYCGCKYSIRKH